MRVGNLKRKLHFASSGHLLNRNIASTGFNIDSSYLHNDALSHCAEEFWINANINKNDPESVYTISKYLQPPFTEITALSGKTVYAGFNTVKLGKDDNLDMSLGKAIKNRKTVRKYSGDSVTAQFVTTILNSCNSITHGVQEDEYYRPQRACASGGGLYPVKTYILALRVANLKKGIYLFDPLNSKLIILSQQESTLNQFIKNERTNNFPNIEDCAFTILFTLQPWKSVAKYGAAGLRFSLIELGAMSQNAHLAATALGLGACPYASFTVDAVNNILCIDGKYESFQHALLFGIESRG